MSSTYKTTYMSGQLDPKQYSQLQNGSESAAGEEVVDEIIGTGASAETETVGFGAETTEAEEVANHKSLSSPLVFRPSTPTTDGEDSGLFGLNYA